MYCGALGGNRNVGVVGVRLFLARICCLVPGEFFDLSTGVWVPSVMVATLVESCPSVRLSNVDPANMPGRPSPPVGYPITVGAGALFVAATGAGVPVRERGPARSAVVS